MPGFIYNDDYIQQLGDTSLTASQAMAGFGGSSDAGESLNTTALGTDTSQPPLLTTPQHA